MMFHTAGYAGQRGRPRRDGSSCRFSMSKLNTTTPGSEPGMGEEKEEESSVHRERNNPSEDENKNLIYFVRKSCGMIVNDERTRLFITFVIIINSIIMGIATYPFVREDPTVARVFAMIDFIFLVIYTVEISLQFIYHGFRMFQDGWLVFDFFIVAISWAFESIAVIRAFRVVRAVRIFRAFRLVGRFKPIREVVSGLLVVMPNLLYITLLLSLAFYINAVFFTLMFKDLYEKGLTEENYFSGLAISSFTLFQIMCLDDWSKIAREVMQTYTWAWVPFMLFLITTTFTVLNMFIAVFCRAIHELESMRNPENPQENIPPVNVYKAFDEQLNILTSQMLQLSKTQYDAIRRINDLSYQLQAQRIRKKFYVKKDSNI